MCTSTALVRKPLHKFPPNSEHHYYGTRKLRCGFPKSFENRLLFCQNTQVNSFIQSICNNCIKFWCEIGVMGPYKMTDCIPLIIVI